MEKVVKNLLIAIVFLASFAVAQTATPDTPTDKPAGHGCACCQKAETKKCNKECCKSGNCKDGSCKDCKGGKGKKGCKNC